MIVEARLSGTATLGTEFNFFDGLVLTSKTVCAGGAVLIGWRPDETTLIKLGLDTCLEHYADAELPLRAVYLDRLLNQTEKVGINFTSALQS